MEKLKKKSSGAADIIQIKQSKTQFCVYGHVL